VVRLKSGDPGIFGRGGEEIAAARDAGFTVEIVPGVTAACAAGASAGLSLTERGQTDTLVLATATGADGGVLPACSRFTTPGTSTAFYMATRKAAAVQSALLSRGLPADTPITVAVDVSKPTERILTIPAGALAREIAAEKISGCAIILVCWPKQAVERSVTVENLATVDRAALRAAG
jgi:uroporphyrin-III C-methyltransferase/precorrin-2 dehydrogenase/sirohydrochlorin ferrochelatase